MTKLYVINVSLHATMLVAADDADKALDIAADYADDAMDGGEVNADLSHEVSSSESRLPGGWTRETEVYAHADSVECGWPLGVHLDILDAAKRKRDLEASQLNLFNGKPKEPTEA